MPAVTFPTLSIRNIPTCSEAGKYWKYSTGLTSVSVLFSLPFRSDPITCARSQHGLGLHLDLLGQPLRGQHRLAAADDPESQGGKRTHRLTVCLHSHAAIRHLIHTAHTHSHTHTFVFFFGGFCSFFRGDFIGCDVIGWHRLQLSKHSICSAQF